MYRLKLLIFGVIFFAQFSFAQTDGDLLFKEDVLHEIRIEGPDLTLMYNTFFGELFDREFTYFSSSVTIDGDVIDSVGVRVKGGSSTFDDKKPLKLDFNKFKAGQEYDGVKKMNLHNFTFDSSFQREIASYEILRTAGLKAPRTAFAQVYLNNQYLGLYGLVEQIDKNFLRNYFADDEGTLIKTGQTDVELKSDTGSLMLFDDLRSFVSSSSVNVLSDSLEKVLDVDAFLRQIVVQRIIGTADNLIRYNYNFYLYQEPKSKIQYFIPWDYNFSFLPWVNFSIDKSPENDFVKKILSVPKFQSAYYRLACEMLNYNYTEERLFPLLDKRKNLIKGVIEDEPYLNVTVAEFEAKTEVLKTWVSTRNTELKSQLDRRSTACVPLTNVGYQAVSINEVMASNDSLSGLADPAGSYPDWIELYNNTTDDILLDGWYLSNDEDFKKHWAFPKGTVIEAESYLIVWADRDIDEAGLHTDFKLSKSGGAVYLSRENLEVVDSIIFPTQNTNIAYARIPNGTGDFVFQDATFGLANGDCNECGLVLDFIDEGQDYEMCNGVSATLFVEANCQNVYYQWQISTDGRVTWSDLNNDMQFGGTISDTLSIDLGMLFKDACFRCIVKDNCDTIISNELKIVPTEIVYQYLQICDNEPIVFNGDTLNQSGRYEVIYQNVDGCDSTIILDLEVLESFLTEIDTTILNGETYEGFIVTQDTFLQKNLTAQNGCDSTVQIQITVETSSINSISNQFEVELFPNPSNGEVIFKIQSPLTGSGVLFFYNTLGQRILERPISTHSMRQKIDIQVLTKGLYFAVLKIENDISLIGELIVE